MRGRVLVVSASMGAGHDGAARELCRRLEKLGFHAETRDFLDAAPWAGWIIKKVFEFQLRSAPWAYEATYRLWSLVPRLCGPAIGLVHIVFGRRIRTWARLMEATAVVSTYPLASLVLGRDRQRGRLDIPTATFVTDFAVHPLWVHPGVDLNLCVHPQSADHAERATGRESHSPGPLVPERFSSQLPDRDRARASLGVTPETKVVLVVAGSWGVGDVEATFAQLQLSSRYLPVVVCGTNHALQARLERHAGGVVLGWTDDMPALMAAADVLVQNAGGLTCMEAFAAGLPVVTYLPIPGHGRENAAQMDHSGVAAYVTCTQDLIPTLDRVTTLAGRSMVARGRALFAGDAATYIAALAEEASSSLAYTPRDDLGDSSDPDGNRETVLTDLSTGRRHTRRHHRGGSAGSRGVGRRLGAGAAAMAVLYTGFNVAADAATAHGIDVARPTDNGEHAYLAVRLGRAQLGDAGLIAAMADEHATAIVSGSVARSDPSGVLGLVRAGVAVANGGWGGDHDYHLLWGSTNVTRSSRAIESAGRTECHFFFPTQAVNGFDLAGAGLTHERIVRDFRLIDPTRIPAVLDAGQIYLIDGRRVPAATLVSGLERIRATFTTNHVTPVPLSALA